MASGFFFLKYSLNSYLNLCCQTFSASLLPGERIWLFIFVPVDLPFSPCRLVSVTASSWHFLGFSNFIACPWSPPPCCLLWTLTFSLLLTVLSMLKYIFSLKSPLIMLPCPSTNVSSGQFSLSLPSSLVCEQMRYLVICHIRFFLSDWNLIFMMVRTSILITFIFSILLVYLYMLTAW